jgi:hypothetical protein
MKLMHILADVNSMEEATTFFVENVDDIEQLQQHFGEYYGFNQKVIDKCFLILTNSLVPVLDFNRSKCVWDVGVSISHWDDVSVKLWNWYEMGLIKMENNKFISVTDSFIIKGIIDIADAMGIEPALLLE